MLGVDHLCPLPRMALPTALVVDDDDAVREVLSTMLRRLGFRAIEAADGKAAIAELNARETLDIVLSDVMMPGGICGDELAGIARRLRPEIRVLLISGGAAGTRAIDAAIEAGETLLQKPITCAQLGDAIADALEIPASA
jgi:DNA-binding NtrC family response regulator